MRVSCLAFHDYVINIDIDISPHLVLKYFVYHTLVSLPNNFHSKKYDLVAICSSINNEQDMLS